MQSCELYANVYYTESLTGKTIILNFWQSPFTVDSSVNSAAEANFFLYIIFKSNRKTPNKMRVTKWKSNNCLKCRISTPAPSLVPKIFFSVIYYYRGITLFKKSNAIILSRKYTCAEVGHARGRPRTERGSLSAACRDVICLKTKNANVLALASVMFTLMDR